MPYIGKGGNNGFGIRERYRYSASGSQTAFTGSDLDSKTLQFDSGSLLDVYLNGVLLDTADYNTSTANTITLTSGATASDEVMIVVYDVFSLSDAMPKTGGTFSGALTNNSTTTLNDDVTFTGANYNVTWDKSDNALEFGDSAKLTFGAGNDLQIYHTAGTGSFIDEADDGSLFIRSSRVTMHKYTGETMINAVADGAVSLYYDDSKKLETVASGVDIFNGSTGNSPALVLKDMNSGVVSGDEGGGLYWYTNDGNGQGNNLAIKSVYENSAGGARFQFEQGTGSGRTTRMTINTDGTVKIGLDAQPSAWALRCHNNSGNATIQARNSNAGNYVFQGLNYNGAQSSYISEGGVGYFASGVSSDETLKNVKGEMNDGWSKLKDIQPKSFTWKKITFETNEEGKEVEVKSDDDLDSNIHYGVMAQDLKKIIPDLAYGEEGGMSVDYNGLLMVAINTIKELEARIKALEEA
jgi:hypothetical protein